MFDVILSLFIERGLICMDVESARHTAYAIVHGQEFNHETCGAITGTIVLVKELPISFSFPSGLGLRVVEGTYLGKTVYFFRTEYQI